MKKRFKNYRIYKKLVQKENETVTEYLSRREEIGIKLLNDGMKMDDTALAVDLMDNSRLTQQEKSIVQTKVDWEKEGSHYDQVKNA